jgi:hypothetical protein
MRHLQLLLQGQGKAINFIRPAAASSERCDVTLDPYKIRLRYLMPPSLLCLIASHQKL